MAAYVAVQSLLETLPNSSDPSSSLKQIKVLLSSVSDKELTSLVSDSTLFVLFNCLETNSRDYAAIICEILEIIVQPINASIVVFQFKREIWRGIHSREDSLISFCLSQILRCVQDRSSMDEFCQSYQDAIATIALLLSHSSIELAKKAADVLIKLAATPVGRDTVFRNDTIHLLNDVINRSSNDKFRVFEMIVCMSRDTPEALDLCHRCGFLKQLSDEVLRDDILVQLNALNLLTDLALCSHGMQFLYDRGVIDSLERTLNVLSDPEAEMDMNTTFLLPGVIKLFGHMAHVAPKEITQRHPSFLPVLLLHLQSGDTSLVLLSLDTVGFIAQVAEGKTVLARQNTSKHALRIVGQLIRDAPSDMRARALQCLAACLRLPLEEQTEELLGITESFFAAFASSHPHITASPVQFLMRLAKQPFPDLRLAAQVVFRNMAGQPWAQKLLHETPGFVEYILDRNTEQEKDGKQSKHEIIKELVASPTAPTQFGDAIFVKLREYVNEGPFFVRAEARVAFEAN